MKDDYQVIYLLAQKLGFADLMFKNMKVEGDRPVPEDVLREMNRGSWSTGYCGQSPERLKAHMRSEEHTSELQSLMRISYAVFCLKKTNTPQSTIRHHDKTQTETTHILNPYTQAQ